MRNNIVKLETIAAPGRSVISGPFGSNIGKKFFQKNGVPVIRGNNLTTNFEKFIDDGFVFLTEQKADELKADALSGDIVFTAAGTIGQIGIIPTDSKYTRYVISNKQLRFRVDDQKADPLYVYYWLASPWVFKFISNHNTGSTVPLINLSIIKSIPIYLPEIEVQKKISSLISSIDVKIELNNQLNTKLETIAKVIYDYWFVQFEFPNENGKPYKSSGGKMVYNKELNRETPCGWTSKKLGDCFDLYQPEMNNEKDFNNKGKFKAYGANGLIGKYHKFNHKESMITIACRGTCGTINQTMPFSWITGNAMVCKPLNEFYSIDYVKNLLNRIGLSRAVTGSVQPQITRANLETLSFIEPNLSILKKYSEVSEPMIYRRLIIQQENEELIKLRDWLLPMLMNGQITFSKAS